MFRLLGAGLVGVLAAGPALAVSSATLVSTWTYGNLHAGGVVVTISGDDDNDAAVALETRRAGGAFRAAHALTRVDATRFVGSVFWLLPGLSYEVRITLSDPDGVTGPATALAALTTRAATLPEPTVRTLYVATTGNDANPGTSPGAPLRTMQRAADLSQAGDLVLIQPGVYRETVTVPRSGTASQPIVFRGNGPAVVLDGADAAIAAGVAWTPATNGVYTRVTGFPTGHVVTELGRLYRYDTLSALRSLAAGAPGGFFFDGATLHVKFADQSAPSAHVMHVARLEDGFFLDGRAFVRVENLEIRHFGSGDYGKGVYLRFSSDVVVRNCRIHENGRTGVWIKGGDRHRVEDNEFWDTSVFNWDWFLVKGSSAEGDAVYMSDDVGRGHVLRRNRLHGSFNGMMPCGELPPPSGLTNEIDIYDNFLYDHNDDGLEPERYCSNIRIWNNRIDDTHMAIAVAPAAPGPVWIVRNVAWRIGNTRTSQQDGWLASALKINSTYPEPVGPLFVYHNTFLTDVPGTDAVALFNPGESTFIRARNNVLSGTRYALYKVNPASWSGNYDDLHTTDPSRLVSWEGTLYNTLAQYRAGQGQELQGISAPPQLVNPQGGDFRPAPGSPLVDAGLVLPGINDGHDGTAPDIGAFERSDRIFTDGFEP
jgi:parallel beta-helix repeat protein